MTVDEALDLLDRLEAREECRVQMRTGDNVVAVFGHPVTPTQAGNAVRLCGDAAVSWGLTPEFQVTPWGDET